MPLPYGYIAYNGHKWLDRHVDIYNEYHARCIAMEEMKGVLPEYMANGRHHLFCMFSGVCAHEGHTPPRPL
jgi:hypothetical protein